MIALLFYSILIIYVILIIQLIIGFDKIKSFQITNLLPQTTFSIIVPFRDEAKNLPALLKSIARLNYPRELFELILIDDFSKDNAEEIYTKWRMENGAIETTLLENLRLSNSPKKDAISRAVPIIKHKWILTTDADCKVNSNWLTTLDNFIQINNPEMVVGAVKYKIKNNWFHWFQQLDLMSLQATTIGSFGIGKPFMCNGANFAYTKKLFKDLGGFGGINDKASGDDVFLLQKAIKNHSEKVLYIKHPDSIVKTNPENDLYKLFMQRVRWASKTTGYSGFYSKFLAAIVLLLNLSLIASFFYLLLTNFKMIIKTNLLVFDWKVLLFGFLVKYILDYILIFKSNYYLRKGKFFMPIASSFIYPIFCSVVGIYALLGNFEWKDRTFSK